MTSHRKSSTLSINSSRNKPLPAIIPDQQPARPISSSSSSSFTLPSPSNSRPQSLSISSSNIPTLAPLKPLQPSSSSNITPVQSVPSSSASASTLSSSIPSSVPSSATSSMFQPKTLKRRNLKKLTLTEDDDKLSNSNSSLSSPNTNNLYLPIRTPSSSSSSKHEDLELIDNFEKLAVSINKDLHLKQRDLLTLKNLGEGQSGIVSKVLHVPSNRIMAKKQILFEKNLKVQNQILRELKILNEVKNPYIIEFYGALFIDNANPNDDSTLKNNNNNDNNNNNNDNNNENNDNNDNYDKINDKSNDRIDEVSSIHSNGVLIFMEYMDCGSLDYILKKLGFLKEVYLCKITHNILQGLNYLYTNHKIIHRDIKPSNVLLNTKGQVKICDFGVSRELNNNSIADTFVGTSTYMSPERIQGDVYSLKGDVWSVGLMLIELSTGEFPFGKKDTPNGILDLLQRIVNEEPPKLSRKKYSKELCEFVDLCLKKQNERPTPLELLNLPRGFIKKYDKEESGPLLRHLAKKLTKPKK